MFVGLIIALAIIVFDQFSKYYILNDVMLNHNIIEVTPYFNLVKAWNTGVSFSMFNNHGIYGVIGLSVMALAIVAFLVYWLYKETSRFIQVALGFVIGGAIGNVIDRLRLGAVYDFLDFHINGSHWPAFNVADSFICIGATLIIVHGIVTNFTQKKGN